MSEKPKELEEYIRTMLDSVFNGSETYRPYLTRGKIKMELEVVNTKEVGGGFKIFVVGAKAGTTKENTSRMTLKYNIRNKPKKTSVANNDDSTYLS